MYTRILTILVGVMSSSYYENNPGRLLWILLSFCLSVLSEILLVLSFCKWCAWYHCSKSLLFRPFFLGYLPNTHNFVDWNKLYFELHLFKAFCLLGLRTSTQFSNEARPLNIIIVLRWTHNELHGVSTNGARPCVLYVNTKTIQLPMSFWKSSWNVKIKSKICNV